MRDLCAIEAVNSGIQCTPPKNNHKLIDWSINKKKKQKRNRGDSRAKRLMGETTRGRNNSFFFFFWRNEPGPCNVAR